MNKLNKAGRSIIESITRTEKRRRKLRRLFPERVVFRRGMGTDTLMESRLGEVRAREEQTFEGYSVDLEKGTRTPSKTKMAASISVGSMSYEGGKERGVKIVPYPYSVELDKLDAKLKRIAKRRRALLLKAWESGITVDWERAKLVSQMATKLWEADR